MDTKPTTPTLKPKPETIEAEIKAKTTSTSKGERLFDWLTYGGIAFAGVFIATMPWTYLNKHGAWKSGADWIKKTFKKNGLSESFAEQTHNTLILGALGNAAIVPVKIMENCKPELVDKFNDMLGDKSNDASVAEDPKQTWWSLIKSRVAAYTAVFVSLTGASKLLGKDKFAKFENDFAEHVVCKPLGYVTHTPNMPKITAHETKAFKYGKIAALDVFATAAATILLYASSRIFAKKNEHWKAPHADADLKAAEAQQPATIPDADLTPPLVRFTDKIQPKSSTPPKREASHSDTVLHQKLQSADTLTSLPA